MLNGIFETGKLVIEIKMLNPEKILNILWNENIDIKKVTRIDVVTLKLIVDYDDYEDYEDEDYGYYDDYDADDEDY